MRSKPHYLGPDFANRFDEGELEACGLYQHQGEKQTDPFRLTQSAEDYIESQIVCSVTWGIP